MGAKRVQIPCSNCSHPLRIRVENLGRKGKCRYCGHRFRPRPADGPPETDQDATARPADRRRSGSQVEPRASARWERMLEQGLEKCWSRAATEQTRMVEQLLATLANRGLFPSQGAIDGPERGPREAPPRALPEALARDEDSGVDLVDDDQIVLGLEDAPGTIESGANGQPARDASLVPLPLPGGDPATARVLAMLPEEIVAVLNHLAGERDEALARCDRWRHKARRLQLELASRVAEVGSLRTLARQLRDVRAERDRLNAERTMLAQDGAQLQTRLIETQFTLVEAEAQLDDLREGVRREQLEWESERAELLAEIDRLQVSLTAALEGSTSEFDQPASTFSA